MAWTSPRREREHAAQLREHIADKTEKHIGRKLTAEELKEIHEQATETAAACARRTRAQD